MARYTMMPDKNQPGLRLVSNVTPSVPLQYRPSANPDGYKLAEHPIVVHDSKDRKWYVDPYGNALSFSEQYETYDMTIEWTIASNPILGPVEETGVYQVGNLRVLAKKGVGLVLQTVSVGTDEIMYERVLIPDGQVDTRKHSRVNLYLRNTPGDKNFDYRVSIYPHNGHLGDEWYDTGWLKGTGLLPIERWLSNIEIHGGAIL